MCIQHARQSIVVTLDECICHETCCLLWKTKSRCDVVLTCVDVCTMEVTIITLFAYIQFQLVFAHKRLYICIYTCVCINIVVTCMRAECRECVSNACNVQAYMCGHVGSKVPNIAALSAVQRCLTSLL